MGGRPSFPPPPVLGRSTLGAVDMPIGCALTLSVPKPRSDPKPSQIASQITANAQQKSRGALLRAGGLTAHAAANDGEFG
jgi:hypothetical protein